MRIILTALVLLPAPASAHLGHIGEVAGHGHWIALGGIAIAGAIALLGARKKDRDSEAKADPEGDAEFDDEEGEPA